ncbi:response regulator [Spirosoma sp. HMF4905]|uniref:Phosphate regulon transcriptional regulatory protein PhoB n=1 Tax=Spirosoma arboris TaxID=2682092 RepID=A0A7K1SNS9_9BACT|nr:response regulator transcription factor [Spirosoma arboris]MVM35313.1 response regulator [Spirosoma arboris]
MKKILIIEDDPLIVDLVRIHLRTLPAEVFTAVSGRDGLEQLTHQAVDLCILDVMLPDMDGIEICRQIRQYNTFTPILMLTAKTQEADKVAGLEAGADDYLTKPFGIQEFVARVRAMLRRSSLGNASTPIATSIITHGALWIHTADRIVTLDGKRIELTPKEFDLLVLLAENPGKSYSRKELLHLVWDYHFSGYEHTVTAHINRLRNKIESDFARPIYILTTWGIGYRFAESIKPVAS